MRSGQQVPKINVKIVHTVTAAIVPGSIFFKSFFKSFILNLILCFDFSGIDTKLLFYSTDLRHEQKLHLMISFIK